MQEINYRDRDTGTLNTIREIFNIPDAQNEGEYMQSKYAEAMAKMTGNKEFISIRQQAIGRNDPCPCGSGRKFKKCCINKVG